MNKIQLQEILNREGYNPRAYCLDGAEPSECYVLSDERSRWCVYYSERGNRNDEKCYPSETEACEDLLQRLKEDPTTRCLR